MLNNGQNSEVIVSVFCERGFFSDFDTYSYTDYPIYADQQILVSGELSLSENIYQFEDLRMLDEGGKFVYHVIGEVSNMIDVSWLGSGVYFIKVGNEKKFQFLKVVLL